MSTILTKLFAAADNHGEDTGEVDHTIGDLQAVMTAAWGLMSPSLRRALLADAAVSDLVDAGGRGEFEVGDLEMLQMQEEGDREARVIAAGYRLMESEDGHHWETADEESIAYDSRGDAALAAEQDLAEKQAA